jgi:hypothetical protein
MPSSAGQYVELCGWPWQFKAHVPGEESVLTVQLAGVRPPLTFGAKSTKRGPDA